MAEEVCADCENTIPSEENCFWYEDAFCMGEEDDEAEIFYVCEDCHAERVNSGGPAGHASRIAD